MSNTEIESKLFLLAIYSNNFINTVQTTIIIATFLISPYQTMTVLLIASPPFCVKLNKEDIFKLQCNLCVLYIKIKIKIKQTIVFKLRFLKSPSYKDDSDESCYLNLKIHRSFAKIAIHLYVFYKDITFNRKPNFVLFLDNMNQNVASSLERKKSKSFRDFPVKDSWEFPRIFRKIVTWVKPLFSPCRCEWSFLLADVSMPILGFSLPSLSASGCSWFLPFRCFNRGNDT